MDGTFYMVRQINHLHAYAGLCSLFNKRGCPPACLHVSLQSRMYFQGRTCTLSNPRSEYGPVFWLSLNAYQGIGFMRISGDEWFQVRSLSIRLMLPPWRKSLPVSSQSLCLSFCGARWWAVLLHTRTQGPRELTSQKMDRKLQRERNQYIKEPIH